jgi:GDP-L-fucose synthase
MEQPIPNHEAPPARSDPGSLSGNAPEVFWSRTRVLVTGGAGFIGQSVVAALKRRGVPDSRIVVPRSRTHDLRVREHCREAVRDCDVVLHLAAVVGGISFSRAHPATQFRDCSQMDICMLEAAREAGVRKFVSLGNLLAYPAVAPMPLREEGLHQGEVADTHIGIGLAKRNLVALSAMYHREFGLNAVNVLSANAYGPRDHFNSPHAHVIPATIVKCFRRRELVVWGDGSPTRDFLFVDDVAEGLLLAAERLEPPDFVNLASGTEISIADLVRRIARLSGFAGPVIFDTSEAGGDPRRVASVDRARRLLGFVPRVDLDEGLRRTIEWYRRQVAAT